MLDYANLKVDCLMSSMWNSMVAKNVTSSHAVPQLPHLNLAPLSFPVGFWKLNKNQFAMLMAASTARRLPCPLVGFHTIHTTAQVTNHRVFLYIWS